MAGIPVAKLENTLLNIDLSLRLGELGRPVHIHLDRSRMRWAGFVGLAVGVGLLLTGWQIFSSAKIYPQLLYQTRRSVSDRDNLERLHREAREVAAQVATMDSLRSRLTGRFGIPDPPATTGGASVSDERLLEELFPDPQGEEAWARSVEDLGEQARRSREALARGFDVARRRMTQLELTPSIMPARGPLSSGFGWRLHPILGEYQMHEGQDITGSVGTPVVATAAGKVVEVEYSSSFGNYVVLAHSGGIRTLYAHLSAFKCQVGKTVRRGETIGLLGNTGRSTGPHIHYEVHVDGRAVDPMHWILPTILVP